MLQRFRQFNPLDHLFLLLSLCFALTVLVYSDFFLQTTINSGISGSIDDTSNLTLCNTPLNYTNRWLSNTCSDSRAWPNIDIALVLLYLTSFFSVSSECWAKCLFGLYFIISILVVDWFAYPSHAFEWLLFSDWMFGG